MSWTRTHIFLVFIVFAHSLFRKQVKLDDMFEDIDPDDVNTVRDLLKLNTVGACEKLVHGYAECEENPVKNRFQFRDAVMKDYAEEIEGGPKGLKTSFKTALPLLYDNVLEAFPLPGKFYLSSRTHTHTRAIPASQIIVLTCIPHPHRFVPTSGGRRPRWS